MNHSVTPVQLFVITAARTSQHTSSHHTAKKRVHTNKTNHEGRGPASEALKGFDSFCFSSGAGLVSSQADPYKTITQHANKNDRMHLPHVALPRATATTLGVHIARNPAIKGGTRTRSVAPTQARRDGLHGLARLRHDLSDSVSIS